MLINSNIAINCSAVHLQYMQYYVPYNYISEANVLHVLLEPDLKPWGVTSHSVVGQECGSEVEKMAASSLCIAPNCTLKSGSVGEFWLPRR